MLKNNRVLSRLIDYYKRLYTHINSEYDHPQRGCSVVIVYMSPLTGILDLFVGYNDVYDRLRRWFRQPCSVCDRDCWGLHWLYLNIHEYAVIKSSSSHKSMTVQTVLHNNHLNTYYVNYVEGVLL